MAPEPQVVDALFRTGRPTDRSTLGADFQGSFPALPPRTRADIELVECRAVSLRQPSL